MRLLRPISVIKNSGRASGIRGNTRPRGMIILLAGDEMEVPIASDKKIGGLGSPGQNACDRLFRLRFNKDF